MGADLLVGETLPPYLKEAYRAAREVLMKEGKIAEAWRVLEERRKQATEAIKHHGEGERRRLEEERRRRLFKEIASLRIFGGVVGLREAKEEIAWKFLIPLFFPEKAAGVKPHLGILLYGPPGVGKSELAKSLAEVCKKHGIQVLSISPKDVQQEIVGRGEKYIAETFTKARRAPSAIIIDEAEAVIGKRQETDSRHHSSTLLQFLKELDGALNEGLKILVIACTNRPDMIDEAALRPGRLGTQIYVPPPSYEERKELFNLFLAGKSIEPPIDYGRLAHLTEPNQIGYYSGDDIREICRDAAVIAAKSGRTRVSMRDLEAAIARRPPSISRLTLSYYNEYRRLREGEAPAFTKRPGFYG